MIVRIAAFALLASPAFAQTHEWGVGTEGPSSVTVAPSDYGLTVSFDNRLIQSVSVQAFDVGPVHILIVSENADIPDMMVVTPPDGYWCDPCQVTVEENATGTVDLWPEVGA